VRPALLFASPARDAASPLRAVASHSLFRGRAVKIQMPFLLTYAGGAFNLIGKHPFHEGVTGPMSKKGMP